MTRKITTMHQSAQHIAIDRDRCIIISNSANGWFARLNNIDYSSGREKFEPQGEAIRVSHLINKQDGGDQIAALFGL